MADITKLCDNLKSFGYLVSVYDEVGEARDRIVKELAGKTVGIGGSVTVNEMGLFEALSKVSEVYWHWMPRDGMSSEDILKAEQRAPYYISSVNAISENGEIVNIDGSCNRVSSISYGHEKVYLIMGENKICPDLESAVYRARNVAAPLNARRLKKNTPCALKADKCYDCSSKDRICKELSVLLKKPSIQNIEVMIIKQKLGY